MSSYRSPSLRDTAREGDVFPSGDDDVFRSERVTPHHRLPDVPLGPLPDLNPRHVRPGVEVTLQLEVDSRLLLGELLHLVTIELSDLAPRVERSYEGGILLARPVLVGEGERILRELLGTVGEGEVTVQTQPGVVKPKPHEGEQEVDLLVDLRDGVPDVLLIVSIVVTAAPLGEGVELVLPDLVEPVRRDARLLVSEVVWTEGRIVE